MGRRPWKYLTPEERAEARREHVRQNVRAYRERNKAKKSESQSVSESQSPTGETSKLSDTSVVQRRNEKQRADARLPLTPASSSSSTSIVTLAKSNLHHNYNSPPSPIDTDVSSHSELAPIDISFGTLQAVVEDLEKVAPIWPWNLAAKTLYSDDRLVDVGILCAGYRILGKLRRDHRATEHAWLPYHRTLQQLQRRLHEEVPLDQAFCVLTATAGMTLFDVSITCELFSCLTVLY